MLSPSHQGWREFVISFHPRFPKGLPAIPTIGPVCIWCYHDQTEMFFQLFTQLGSETAIRKWLGENTTNAAWCNATPRSDCSIVVGEIANILQTVQQITHGIEPYKPTTPEQAERDRLRHRRAAIIAPAPETAPEEVAPPPKPLAIGYVIWGPGTFAKTPAPVAGAGGKIQTSEAFYETGAVPWPGYVPLTFTQTDPGLPSYP